MIILLTTSWTLRRELVVEYCWGARSDSPERVGIYDSMQTQKATFQLIWWWIWHGFIILVRKIKTILQIINISWSYMISYCRQHNNYNDNISARFALTNRTPCFALTGEIGMPFVSYMKKNYHDISRAHCITCLKIGWWELVTLYRNKNSKATHRRKGDQWSPWWQALP